MFRMLVIPGRIVRCPQSHQKLHENQSCTICDICIYMQFFCLYAPMLIICKTNICRNMLKYVQNMQIYAKTWTYLHINVNFNKYVKYEQVAYLARNRTAAVWCC